MRRWIVVLLPLLPLALLLAYVRMAAVGPQAHSAPDAVAVEVVYLVRGTAHSAAVTYSNATSGTEQQTVVLPWDHRMERARGTTAYISAQSQDADGSVICEIVIATTRTADSTGEGASEHASCSSLVP